MAELLQRFSGNPFSTSVGQKIEQATDASLDSENWALNMEICDHINDTDEGPRDAVRAIKKRLQQSSGKNFTVVMFTLIVLEACVKNCGKRFHILVTNKDFVQELVKLIGPKNDPPTNVQEKVLSLIQSWAHAFRGQPDLQGVVQVYSELKSKGIEFPAIDTEAMPPIHTPQRTKSATSNNSEAFASTGAHAVNTPLSTATGGSASGVSQSHPKTMPTTRRAIQGPMQLTPEQLAKLRSELDIVQSNMKVFNEMLTELTPGSEHNDDWQLLSDLNATCQTMQTRIVELIERVANEEVTNELLRVNDELNNLFLRYERHAKKHKPQLQSPTNRAQQAPQQPSEPTLIDFDSTDDSTAGVTSRLADIQLSGISAAASKPVESATGDLDFDAFAQSRSTTNKDNNISDLSTAQVPHEQEFDEIEKWLEDEPAIAGNEFDRFLAERAAAVEKQPPKPNTDQPKPDDKNLL
ncbi:TOM1-like protein 2 [Oppia nitens]|uniref:TOM1-like protein 2 n=1 Tax=Oppia nitens TaxID=1686743 RepID=UPI0023DC7433|nr:TOM1-like protein 2 [Oppia nitens]